MCYVGFIIINIEVLEIYHGIFGTQNRIGLSVLPEMFTGFNRKPLKVLAVTRIGRCCHLLVATKCDKFKTFLSAEMTVGLKMTANIFLYIEVAF